MAIGDLAKGNVALNLTLTGVNAITCLLTLPLVVNFSVAYFMGADHELMIGSQKLIQVIAIVAIPVSLGMLLRRFRPGFADRADKPVKLLASFFLLLLISVSAWIERHSLISMISVLGIPVTLLSVISLWLGYIVSRAMRLSREDATAIGMEVGIHNTGFAIYIAKSIMGSSAAAIPAALYTIVAYATAGVMTWFLLRRRK